MWLHTILPLVRRALTGYCNFCAGFSTLHTAGMNRRGAFHLQPHTREMVGTSQVNSASRQSWFSHPTETPNLKNSIILEMQLKNRTPELTSESGNILLPGMHGVGELHSFRQSQRANYLVSVTSNDEVGPTPSVRCALISCKYGLYTSGLNITMC